MKIRNSLTVLLLIGAGILCGQTATAGTITAESTGGVDWSETTVPSSGSGSVGVAVRSPDGIPTYAASINGVPAPWKGGFISVSFGPPGSWINLFVSHFGAILSASPKTPGNSYHIEGTVTGTTPPSPPGSSANAYATMGVVSPTTVNLLTYANVVNSRYALGQARDPLTFGPGTTTFNATFGGISLTSTGGQAGFLATGSSTIPGLQNLFSLVLYAPGSISSKGDILLAFQSNPLLGLNDSSILSQIQGDLSLSGNTISLTSPITITYSLDSATSYDTEVTANSEAEVREPPVLAMLFGSGMFGLATVLRRFRAPHRGGMA